MLKSKFCRNVDFFLVWHNRNMPFKKLTVLSGKYCIKKGIIDFHFLQAQQCDQMWCKFAILQGFCFCFTIYFALGKFFNLIWQSVYGFGQILFVANKQNLNK